MNWLLVCNIPTVMSCHHYYHSKFFSHAKFSQLRGWLVVGGAHVHVNKLFTTEEQKIMYHLQFMNVILC